MASEAHAYSVWALPPEEARVRVKKLMDNLRSEFGGPEFDPHLTVVRAVTLTPEDALDRFRSACNGVKAYSVHARGISIGTCLNLIFDPTPQVVATSEHCCGHFGFNRTAAYRPHMSLLYADLTNEMMKKAEERATILDDSIANLCFTVNRLALYITDEDKTLKSWKKVAEYELQPI
ncbi:hypothetical protein BVRB_8g188360 [Beta vulgaris subsp. vulgaris]|uniref:cyclic phosphodiesterase n=1 Tax=Beta vulgaris subsp. vulgaris TaxID=3555 RepID=UPI00053F81F5|nr:cyclic phosphodiesterase [Beta vulgaris subsp. vulgaris]KMT03865.1 hypothetical protein BVRB_8g188360 [Beta vulgaris subsp. vulgaris]